MSIASYGSVWCIDHCLSIASLNFLDEKEMKKCFEWINVRRLYKKKNNSKLAKIDQRFSLLEENKAYQFLKLNEN